MGRSVHYFDHITPHLGDTDNLTPRRAQVLELVAQGLTTEDIAFRLEISEDTVRTHIEALRNQFHALNRVELIYQACAHGVLKCDATFCKGFQLSATVEPGKARPIDFQFHRAQARLRTRQGVSLGQKVVALFLRKPSDNDSSIYDIPAYLRREIAERDQANFDRAVQYAARVKAHIQEQAA